MKVAQDTQNHNAEKYHEEWQLTEIGFIPHDWTIKSFKEVTLKIGDGIHSTPAYSSTGEYYFINGNNLVSGKILVDEETKKISSKEFRKYKQVLGRETILLSINGTIGNRAFYNAEPILLGKSAAFLNVNSECNLKYIYYILNSKQTLDQFNDGLTGSTIKNLGLGTIRNTLVPMPILAEQQKIATALSDTDALISELEKLIEKKQAIKTATMQQLLTGKTRLPEFALREDGTPKGYKDSELGQIPEDWCALTIGSDTTLKARIGWQALTTDEYLKEGSYYLVTGTDFNGGLVNWNSCCYVTEWRYKQDKNIQLQQYDVLVTKDGTIGKVGFIESLPLPATLNSGVFVVRPKLTKCLPRFLFYILTSSYFDDFVKLITAGSTIVHLYQKDFVNFKFYVPQSLEEQEAIASILSKLDKELSELKQKLIKFKNIKQGMMQELLTGKTRLV